MAVNVPALFSTKRRDIADDRDRLGQFQRNRRAYKRLERRMNRIDPRPANAARRKRLLAKQEAVKTRETDQSSGVRDAKRMEKQSQQRQKYLRLLGSAQANQEKQFDLLKENIAEQTAILRQEAERRTSLQEEILQEQQQFEALQEARANREGVLASELQARLARGVQQANQLSTGRLAAAQRRRVSRPTRSIIFG